ncbi:MAG TPA: SPOR domain-containing protein [Thermoanaerobaculia bacterium]|nr:SPOR domain-containing protein [Thermoanaerobaculia bacterium]
MEEVLTDDQSHYEISLTAGQAFVAFVLLLLSLAAAFAFGLLIGRGATDEHLVVRKDSPVIAETTAVPAAKRVVADEDFKEPAAEPAPARAPQPATIEGASVVTTSVGQPAEAGPHNGPVSAGRPAEAAPDAGPAYAQLVSTSDQKTAETLAAKLIEGGFTSAYVERGATEKGTVFRVRVKFASEAEAHAAEAKLKQFSKDVWITK